MKDPFLLLWTSAGLIRTDILRPALHASPPSSSRKCEASPVSGQIISRRSRGTPRPNAACDGKGQGPLQAVGIKNPLFCKDNIRMFYGDSQEPAGKPLPALA